ncbi:sensory rhodopsin transducer [Paenibacillus hexagrammi]|uniref:Sensory rhodopsin transducer n=1 Tax=Paenibacillus hexagrammi TaxID=2908839 RepID=A0ABY3SQP7_9BACL|nr:sensory rhodopsin transducer [Paenibacillus sp. YPD9-1]UJF36004.1 sensory rhodopsin transducer [Paenibacillus sp. YPD9-1]
MYKARGEKYWFIPDGYIPEKSSGELTSHESVCVLNTSSDEALLRFTIFFEDREPMEDILHVVPARRTRHIRTSSLMKDGAPIPIGVPYAIEVQSDIPIIVQYSRLDSTQAENTLMSTMAFAVK